MKIEIVCDNNEPWWSPVKYEIHVDGDYFKAKKLCRKEFPFAMTLWGARRLAKQIAEDPKPPQPEQAIVETIDI